MQQASGAAGSPGASIMANANGAAGANPAPAPASGPSSVSVAAPTANSQAAPRASVAETAPAAIVDAPGSNRGATAEAAYAAREEGRKENDGPPQNPLSALAAAAPAATPNDAALAEKGKTPEGKAAEGKTNNGKAEAKTASRANHTPKARKKADGDAALLSALMSYGLPPPSAAAAATLPGTPLGERLQQCRRKPFLESEQCRLQVCAGQWGLAPECPNPQAQTQAPARP
ncbi:hypothetical protein C7R54_21070 [Achromobacter aloeverae]|uniref:Uncharacterized protein n=2 Tax=Achromobacter aloeverae TaxID=1750518 RepID=A0A4Q1HI01_9BURK|nr:hypothetical protein C7R54_21070 [Achromobacter aloeverae]